MKRKNRPRHGAIPQSHVALSPNKYRDMRLCRAVEAMLEEATRNLERQIFEPSPVFEPWFGRPLRGTHPDLSLAGLRRGRA